MACNKCNQKSALTAYTDISTTLTTGENLVFNNNYISDGVSITHTAGTSTINLVKSGLYLVTLNATGVESGTAGNITVQLYRNGVAVPGAISTVNSNAATEIRNVNITVLIKATDVCPCSGNGISAIPLVFTNTGVGTTYSSMLVNVVKLA